MSRSMFPVARRITALALRWLQLCLVRSVQDSSHTGKQGVSSGRVAQTGMVKRMAHELGWPQLHLQCQVIDCDVLCVVRDQWHTSSSWQAGRQASTLATAAH